MDKMIVVACAVIIHENKILVTQRGPGMSLPGKWEFPGGKIEPDETSEDCIKREIMEELGILINPIERMADFFHDYGTFQINLIPFISGYLSGKIRLTEHQQFMWVPLEELINLDWAPADLNIAKTLILRKF